ncbi:MAG: ATP-binding cassette domain-containing protein [Puniceicoccales bacterium]|nr:ATP-binding cassette domain-containing protein [Puniceicoccales bacterium]
MSNFVAELRDVHKSFGNTVVFCDVNFAIAERDTVSICGDSGSGKTTLINVLGLLEPPTSGRVIWESCEVTYTKMSRVARLRSKIFGYIFQQCNLIPELNVVENLMLPKRIAGEAGEADVDFVRQLLRQTQLTKFENRAVSTLSGGERQKVAAIRAMVNRPRVIVADEPTGNLDEKSANLVMDAIVGLCNSCGSALLLITHNKRFAEKMQTSYVLTNMRLRRME